MHGALGELFESDRKAVNVVAVEKILTNHDIDHAEHERGVSSGTNLDVPVRRCCCPAPQWVNDDDLCTLALRFGDEGPVMQHVADHVASPKEDEAGVRKAFRIEARRHPKDHLIGRPHPGRTKGPLSNGGAKAIEKSIAAVEPVEQTLMTHITAGHDGLRPMAGNDRLEPAADLGERSVPGDLSEVATPLRACATERMQDSLGAVDSLFVVLDLHAKSAPRERMIRIAADAHNPPIAHRCQHRTRVGAIMRARTQKPMFIHASFHSFEAQQSISN